MGFGDFLGSALSTVATGGLNLIVPAIGEGMGSVADSFTPKSNYNATSPLDVAALRNQLAQSQGNLATNQQNQDALAKALLMQSQGVGPNPVQSQLNQATNQNIAQNAGFVSSQKGINPALAARLASENAANISQQAAGQGAILNTQQQLGAQNALGNLYGNIANQNLQNAQLSGALANQSSLGAQQINAGTAAQNAAATQNTMGGFMNGIGSAVGMFLNKGGTVPKRFHPVAMIYHGGFPENPSTEQLKSRGGAVPGEAKVSGDSPKNDTVPTLLSPDEIVLPRSVTTSKDPAKEAARFVAEELRKRGRDKNVDAHGDFKSALKKAVSSRRG